MAGSVFLSFRLKVAAPQLVVVAFPVTTASFAFVMVKSTIAFTTGRTKLAVAVIEVVCPRM